jgi:hypothetical protein
VDELYRGYRIAIRQTDRWVARVTHVRGTHMPLDTQAALHEGAGRCLEKARLLVDRYIAFLDDDDIGREPN